MKKATSSLTTPDTFWASESVMQELKPEPNITVEKHPHKMDFDGCQQLKSFM